MAIVELKKPINQTATDFVRTLTNKVALPVGIRQTLIVDKIFLTGPLEKINLWKNDNNIKSLIDSAIDTI
jgi:hypothetical protein